MGLIATSHSVRFPFFLFLILSLFHLSVLALAPTPSLVYIGAYSMVLGVLTLLYELFFGRPQRTASRLPWRAICYGVCAVPLMVAYPTRIPGVLYCVVALINLVSACRGESVSMRARREQRQVEAAQTMIDYTNMSAGSVPQAGSSSSFLPRSFKTFFLNRSVRFRFRRWALLLFYVVAANTALVVLCWAVLVRDVHKKWELDEDGQPWNRCQSACAHNNITGTWHLRSFFLCFAECVVCHRVRVRCVSVCVCSGWQIGLIAQWLLLLSLIPFFFTSMRWVSRQLYDLSVGASMPSTTSFAGRAAQFVLTFLPPDPHNTLLFYHKFIAAAVMLYSCAHGLAHTLSFMVEPRDTLDFYGRSSYWVFTSGGIMIVLLIVIYSAARREIREGSLLLFRWVHALYAPFLLLLVLHSKSGFSTLSVLFVFIPMSLWLLDKCVHYYRSGRIPFPVLSVAHVRPNALRIECSTRRAPDAWRHFEEGAFAYVKFPAVSTSIAIPVTISSPPPALALAAAQADGWSAMDVSGSSSGGIEMLGADAGGSSSPGSITLHLQIDSASLHSYTARVQEYFESLGPLGSSHYVLDQAMRGSDAFSASAAGALGRGLLHDRSGRRLVQLDGPHPSPVSHVTRYTSCMVVAPSAGVPALSSVLRSVVLQRWKQQLVGVGAGGGIGQMGGAAPRGFFSTPHALFLYWILPWDEIDDHRWFLQTIKGESFRARALGCALCTRQDGHQTRMAFTGCAFRSAQSCCVCCVVSLNCLCRRVRRVVSDARATGLRVLPAPQAPRDSHSRDRRAQREQRARRCQRARTRSGTCHPSRRAHGRSVFRTGERSDWSGRGRRGHALALQHAAALPRAQESHRADCAAQRCACAPWRAALGRPIQ